MKLILFIFLVMVSTASFAQRRTVEVQDSIPSRTKVVSQIPVGTKYFAADIEGFALSFVDRHNQISMVSDIKNDIFIREGKPDHDPEVTILWDEEIAMYRVAENLMEYRREKDGERTVSVKRSKIIELKQSKIE